MPEAIVLQFIARATAARRQLLLARLPAAKAALLAVLLAVLLAGGLLAVKALKLEKAGLLVARMGLLPVVVPAANPASSVPVRAGAAAGLAEQ